jgi:hypothetical protein
MMRKTLALLALPLALGLAPALRAQTSCAPSPAALCLQGSRFQAEVTWTAPGFGSGKGQAVPLTRDTGFFWFFSNSNVELVVKVLDGRAVNRHFWVFFSGLSDVQYTLTVTDLQTGAREVFTNPQGRLASVSDITAFNPEGPPAAVSAAAPAAAAGAPSEAPLRLGPEFQASAGAAGDQVLPAVAMAPDGSFLVAWSTVSDVLGRVYDATGAPRTGDIRLNDTALSGGREVHVAANAAGEFLAVWPDSPFDARSVQARLVGPDGHLPGGVIQLSSVADDGFAHVSTPDVAADPAGGFLTAWNEYGGLGVSAMVTRRLDAQGGRLGPQVTFDAQHSFDAPRVAASPRGGFLVAWASVNPQVDAPVSDLWAERLDASGQALGGPFVLNGQIRPLPGAARLAAPVFYADGGFAVIWSQTTVYGIPLDGLYACRYSASGTPAGPITKLQSDPPAAFSTPAGLALPSGDTWVVWSTQAGLADSPSGIDSGVFDSGWTLQGEVARVNTYVSWSSVLSDPAVAAAGGNAVAVWDSNTRPLPVIPLPPSQDGSGSGVFGQRLALASCAVDSSELCLGGRFRVAVQFTDPRNGQTSAAAPVPITSDTGSFWFFDPANLELTIKVVDGRPVNGHFWVFYGALSDVAYTITVTDTVTGNQRTYHNDPHHLASASDVSAFAGSR